MSTGAHAEGFLAQLVEIMPAGYRMEFYEEMLWVISSDGGRAGTSSPWLTDDVLLEEEVVLGFLGNHGGGARAVARHTSGTLA